MKKYFCTALALLLAASLFTGCGCTNQNVSNHPGGKVTAPTTPVTTNPMPTMTTPTTETTTPPTQTTAPTQATTEPGMSDATIDTEPGTGSTDDTAIPDPARSRSRSMTRYH